MKVVRNILSPIEFTHYSLDLLEYVTLFAESLGARLHLLHVITGAAPFQFDALNEFFRTVQHTPPAGAMADTLDLIKVHVKAETAWQGICRYAAEAEADIIMMADHRPGGGDSATLGRTVLRVLEKSPCPVMVIRLPGDRGATHHSRFEMTLQEIKKELATRQRSAEA